MALVDEPVLSEELRTLGLEGREDGGWSRGQDGKQEDRKGDVCGQRPYTTGGKGPVKKKYLVSNEEPTVFIWVPLVV